MINCILALCAESVITDKVTNNISIFNIIEEMKSMGFPSIAKLTYYFYMTRDKKNAEVHDGLLIITLDDEQLSRIPVNIDFKGKLKNRVIIRIDGYVIPRPGNLNAILKLRGKEYGKCTIRVDKIGTKVETSST